MNSGLAAGDRGAPPTLWPMEERAVRREVYVRRRLIFGIGAASVMVLGGLGLDALRSDGATLSASLAPSTAAAANVTTSTVAPGSDVDGGEFTAGEGCTLSVDKLTLNDSGTDVACLQTALANQGVYSGPLDGTYDEEVLAAVSALQQQEELFVDGVVGNETAGLLGIRKPVELHVVRTSAPAPETIDSTGYYLSSVATVGSDAPALPEESGSGRRVVYDRLGQRVWAVDADGDIVRSWLVSGSRFTNEIPGTYQVYSKSEQTTAWNGKARLPKMIRYLQTDIGHIGFHGIPVEIETGKPYQTDAELGTPLSGGCQRQADLDAAFLWAWADIGTTVVVI